MVMSIQTESSGNNDGLVFFEKDGKAIELDKLMGSQAEALGRGTFGTTYKANLEGMGGLAVKRLMGPCAFGREKIAELGRMVHENLLPLKAYRLSKQETLLIFDYMPSGSLADFLHWRGSTSNGTPLNWQVRGKIAHEVARGIEYLHSQGNGFFSHGNIRSSNIFLTNNSFKALVSEFGIAQLFRRDSKVNRTGYQAPELAITSGNYHVSQKADVYNFGVLLLELVTGKPPDGEEQDLPKWVRLMFQEKPIVELFDPKLLTTDDDKDTEQQMFQILQLAICCTFEYPQNRPSMGLVANQIRKIFYSALS